MPSCPHCDRYLSVHLDECPACGAADAAGPCEPQEVTAETLRSSDGARLVQVARFGGGAEAGFFAHELARETGIETETLLQEKFDGIHGQWQIHYALHVPESRAKEAAAFLQTLLARTNEAVDEDVPEENISGTSPSWVPLLITLAAGSVTYWGVQRLEHRPPPAIKHQAGQRLDDFWDVVGTDRIPWTQAPGGREIRRLWIDRRHNQAVLQEDQDRDGVFETESRFRINSLPRRQPPP